MNAIRDMYFKDRGPCCERYEKLQHQAQGRLKAMHLLLGGNPRYLSMWQHGMKPAERRLMQLGLDSKSCPCHEAPDPPMFRKFVSYVMSQNETAENDIELGALLDAMAHDFLENRKETDHVLSQE